MRRRLRVLVSGMVAGDPGQGGASWAVLQYLLGLRRLGHEVHLAEPVAAGSVRPRGATLEGSENAAWLHRVLARHGLEGCGTLVDIATGGTCGWTAPALKDFARGADVHLNVSGMLVAPEWTSRIPSRVYLDLDPGFNQLWHAAMRIDMRFEGHTHFATVGHRVGTPSCGVPACGRAWIPTLPPVVLAWWPECGAPSIDAFTTVANWRSYGSIEHEGVHYGQKAHSFRRLFALPRRCGGRFVAAMSMAPEEQRDRELLGGGGWELADPAASAGTPWDYHAFVSGSRAEIGVAKSGYVAARCGWFSDRSACYLASGRPVVAQDTGFGDALPTGLGLLAFADLDGAAEAVASVRADYAAHARAARAIAEEHLDSDRVLARLLSEVGAS